LKFKNNFNIDNIGTSKIINNTIKKYKNKIEKSLKGKSKLTIPHENYK